ncbi:MAG TPA: phosphotransferase [Steroidobacteraceae bacterium]|nr:phosphotransferase [Steroidobacteraceae bacterium]
MTTGPDATLGAVLGGFAAGREALAMAPRIEALAGGLDNLSWRVTSAVGDWVVRCAGSRDQRYAINRVAERQAQAAAAALGFAPAIVHAEPERGILVSEHLAGRVWTRDEARAEPGIRALGARLGALHAAPPPRDVRRINVHDVLAHYLELRGVPPGPVSRDDIGARLRWSLATYRHAPPALCHNDLHHQNLIGEAPLRFVDWEYAGVGDPVFELAAVIGYHDYDADQRELLLAAHGGGFKAAHVTRMCLVFDCLHALWLDAAGGWDSLSPERRQGLIARLSVDPTIRTR